MRLSGGPPPELQRLDRSPSPDTLWLFPSLHPGYPPVTGYSQRRLPWTRQKDRPRLFVLSCRRSPYPDSLVVDRLWLFLARPIDPTRRSIGPLHFEFLPKTSPGSNLYLETAAC